MHIALTRNDARVFELANRGVRIAKLNRGRHRHAQRLAALQLDDDDRTSIGARARDVDDEEVARECALARAIEPEVRAPLEKRAREFELIALEREELSTLPCRRQTIDGVTTRERGARKAQDEYRRLTGKIGFKECGGGV